MYLFCCSVHINICTSHNKTRFDPAKDIPDLSGKVILVTGGTNGLGKETVLYLAAHNPAGIIFTGRRRTAAEAVIEECRSKHQYHNVTFLPCDLSSLAAIKTAANSLLADLDRLDIVLAVAGVMALSPGLSADGYEIQFATNHLGHALLLDMLLPLLKSTATSSADSDVRVIVYTSGAIETPLAPSGGIDFASLRTVQNFAISGGMRRYSQSKLANLFHAQQLAKRNPDLTVVPIHPGMSYTGLLDSMSTFEKVWVGASMWFGTQPAHEVAHNGLWAATAPVKGRDQRGAVSSLPLVESGVYFRTPPVGTKGKSSGYMADETLSERLWDWTQKELEVCKRG